MSNIPPQRLPPGPSSVFSYRHLVGIRRDPLRFYRTLWEKYGDVVRVSLLGSTSIYLLSHPEDIVQVLRSKSYSKGPLVSQMKMLVGTGLLTASGKHWHERRKTAQPAFHTHCLEATVPIIQAETTALAKRWQEYAHSGDPVDIVPEVTRCTFGILTQTFFGTDLSGATDLLNGAINEGTSYVHYRAYHPFSLPKNIPTTRNRRFLKARRHLDLAASALVQARRRTGYHRDDLLDRFMRGEEEGRSAHDDILTFIMAGLDTTASALAWTLYMLAQHQDVAERLQDELAHVLSGRMPEADDVDALCYTRQVIQETLRLYAPAWGLGRKADTDEVIREYDVPAGTPFVLNIHLAQRHPDVWDTPGVFDPDRFSTERLAGHPDRILLTFGGGRRGCMGGGFAMMEMVLIVAIIMQRYTLRLAPGAAPPTPLAQVTLRPYPGIHLIVHPRV